MSHLLTRRGLALQAVQQPASRGPSTFGAAVKPPPLLPRGPGALQQTQCGSVILPLLDLSGPFKTKCGSAVIEPAAAATREPGTCLPPTSLTGSSKSAWTWDLTGRSYWVFFSYQFGLEGVRLDRLFKVISFHLGLSC